jgi:hemoglobin
MTPTSTLSHDALSSLVTAFYARVRADDVLATVFNTAIPKDEWPQHLGRMADFWSSVMLASGRYHGSPMAAHLKHRHAIHPAMFERWLALWSQTACELLPEQDAQAVIAKALRIAESLQLGLFFRLPSARHQAA